MPGRVAFANAAGACFHIGATTHNTRTTSLTPSSFLGSGRPLGFFGVSSDALRTCERYVCYAIAQRVLIYFLSAHCADHFFVSARVAGLLCALQESSKMDYDAHRCTKGVYRYLLHAVLWLGDANCGVLTELDVWWNMRVWVGALSSARCATGRLGGYLQQVISRANYISWAGD